MTDTMKHVKQQTFSPVLSCILFIQKSSSIFQSCDRFKSENLTRLLLRKKKKVRKKKMHLGQVFQTVMSFET